MVEVAHRSASGRDRAQSWRAIVAEHFGLADLLVRDGPSFTGAVTNWRLGALDLTSVTCSSEFVDRRLSHVRADRREKVILVNIRRGTVRLRQSGVDAVLGPGSIILYSPDAPFRWEHDTLTDIDNVAFPAAVFHSRFRNLEGILCRPFVADAGPWKIASDFLGSLAAQNESLPRAAADAYAGHLVDLVATALDCDDAPSSTRVAIRRRVESFVRAHLADADLGPRGIAAAIGISVRYLHRLFEESELSLGAFILDRRLSAARGLLCDSARSGLPVAEIALRCGFRSHSSFARSFREHFGMSPTAFRSRATG